MLIRSKPSNIILSSEITPREIFEARRQFIKQCAVGAIGSAGLLEMANRSAFAQNPGAQKLAAATNSNYVVIDNKTAYKDATTYNNYYEFGTDKSEPAQSAGSLKTRPWSVSIEGEINKPMKLDLDSLMKIAPLEERIYRLRCVEGWSMVIPWIGFSLSNLIKKVEPNSNAKYIEFTTLADKSQMPGLREGVLDWPYVEGLRMDEAMHPLALLTFGMYGEVLPNQNGAPVRMVLPWKYGFKSPKSIVKIRFTNKQPKTAWNTTAPREYGFYSNVNPEVDHPRWSQASERRIGEDGFFTKKRKTLMFNGYSEVASLYSGMDLKKYY
ncbi:protein-methionine-sulfoxide reductase catalytic subunit MsrP [Solimicrobium silvestre]|uniref:Protein-methionine-sulfoxide reductase catalytic subunit MsrP n=1 Tax=Solimicrobium silvestre TaxID=2099400 RepID=A0A2S9H4A2_9BURK|nr:protein-methionine-sulfoxide reductase catalytic subunit MsrP [Solimicrobium silvestre]PRC94771.1 Sulfite oxidase [Solimicrobium silvestre]